MFATLTAAALTVTLTAAPPTITGQYVEARTCDVWTGPCFANADHNLTGKNALLAWRIERGTLDGVRLDGLSVVAVVAAGNTIGLEQSGPSRAVVIVDSRATPEQRAALVRLAQKQAGKLVGNVASVQSASINLTTCPCTGDSCYELQAGGARLKTRCIDAHHDKACGNEIAFYPPLARGVSVRPAAAVEHVFSGSGLRQTYSDYERRGAYVGTFAIR
ncbi:MAG: DUF1326 domain-containing protein [Gemmataceae bacterium]|nr:DUF1326 domain-containing protein [Gemmataceae bacterium]